MGKSAKAKKAKKADFSKVKLKVGKRLPRGQNVTDTTFKARKIVIAPQHRRVGSVSASGKDAVSTPTPGDTTIPPLAELVARVKNSSGSSCVDALDRLVSKLKSTGAQMAPDLGSLVASLGPLLSSLDERIRVRCHSSLRLIVGCVSRPALTAVLSPLASHLGCALTHLDCDVRRDGVQVLALLLESCSADQLTAARVADRLLVRLLQLVSSGARASHLDDPRLRSGAVAWRVGVLQHVARLLETLPASTHILPACGPISSDRSSTHCSVGKSGWCSVFDCCESSEGPLFAEGVESDSEVFGERGRLCRFAEDAVNSLMRCLAELGSEAPRSRGFDTHQVDHDSAQLLQLTVRVVLALLVRAAVWDSTASAGTEDTPGNNSASSSVQHWFADQLFPTLCAKIVDHFPFVATAQFVGRDDDLALRTTALCDQVNTQLCQLIVTVHRWRSCARLVSRALQYMDETFTSSDSGDSRQRVTAERLCTPLFLLLQDESIERTAREAAIDAAAGYFSQPVAALAATGLQLLSRVMEDHRLARAYGSRPAMIGWGHALLQTFVRGHCDSEALFMTLQRMALMGTADFVSGLQSVATEVLARLKLQTTRDTPGSDLSVQQKNMINILFMVRQCHSVSNCVEAFLNDVSDMPQLAAYVRHVLVQM